MPWASDYQFFRFVIRHTREIKELLTNWGFSTLSVTWIIKILRSWQKLLAVSNPLPVIMQLPSINREQPLYVVKTHTQTEGLIHLMSALKKSGLFFRAFDPREVPRLSLHEATKQVFSSLGVIVPLLSEGRTEAVVHNARCAFVAGLAMASGKHVVMIQEGDQKQPIDYRDVVRTYELPRLPSPYTLKRENFEEKWSLPSNLCLHSDTPTGP